MLIELMREVLLRILFEIPWFSLKNLVVGFFKKINKKGGHSKYYDEITRFIYSGVLFMNLLVFFKILLGVWMLLPIAVGIYLTIYMLCKKYLFEYGILVLMSEDFLEDYKELTIAVNVFWMIISSISITIFLDFILSNY